MSGTGARDGGADTTRGLERTRGPLAQLFRVGVPWALAWTFVALACLSLSGRMLSAQLDGAEAAVAARVSEATGFDVHIDRLNGRFLDWFPVLEIDGVDLSRDGCEVLAAERLVLRIDVAEALLRRRPIAADLIVEELRVALEQDENGIRLRNGTGGAALDLEQVVSFLYDSDHVELRGGRVEVFAAGAAADATPLARVDGRASTVGNAFEHRVSLQARVQVGDSATGSLHLELDLDGDPLDPSARAGRMLLEASDLELAALEIPARLMAISADGVLEGLRVRADVDPARGTTFTVHADAASVDLRRDEERVEIRNFRTDIDGHFHAGGVGDLRVRALQAQVIGEQIDLEGMRVALRATVDGSRRVFGTLGPLDVESLARVAGDSDLLNERARRWLDNLKPKARIERAAFVLDPEVRQGAVSAKLTDVALRGYRGVPTVRGIDTMAVVYDRGAWLDIDSDAFYLHFTDVFPEGWRYDRAVGRADLRFDPSGLQLRSEAIDILGPQGRIRGSFAMHLPDDPFERRIALAMGVEGADAAFTEAFLPTKLDPQLRDWLRSAVRAGRVDRGGIVLNGAVRQRRAVDRATAIWGDMRAGRIAFDPAWPTATSVDGRVLVASDGVRGTLTRGRVAGLEIGRVSLTVPRDPRAPRGMTGNEVFIRGEGRGDGNGVLDFLRVAPVGDTFDFLEDAWAALGAVDFRYDMLVPLDGRPVEHLDIEADLLLERLHIGQADVDLQNFSGRLTYRHPGLIGGDGLEAELFGGPVAFSVEGNMEAADVGLLVRADGEAEGRAIATWLGVDVLARLAGRAPYAGDLRILPDGASRLSVESPISPAGDHGFVTNLPPPLAAPSASLRLDLSVAPDAALDLEAHWGAFASRMVFVDGDLERGVLALDVELPEPPSFGLAAIGRAEQLEVGAWLDAIERWEQDAIVLKGGDARSSVDDLLFDFELVVDDTRWDTQHFGATKITLGGFLSEMTLGFDAERILGHLVIPEDERPLVLALDRLDLPLDPARPLERPAEDELDTSDVDADSGALSMLLKDLDPATVPAMDVAISAFSDHGDALGTASFDVRPYTDGLRLVDIDAAGRGLLFGPDADGRAEIELALVPWPATRIRGQLSGDDAERTLERFGFAPTVSAAAFAFGLDVGWEGPLDAPEVESLSGTVTVDVARGRFMEIEAGGGPLRMVGLLNVDAIARRMRFDFSDIFQRGVAFEEIDGVLALDEGRLMTSAPVRIVGPQSRIVVTGDLDIASRALDGELVVTLPVSKNLPWAAAYAALFANPLAGAGVMVAERIFRDQIDKYSSARYRIGGTVDEPEVLFDTIFDNEVGGSVPTEQSVEGPAEGGAAGAQNEPLAAATAPIDSPPEES